MARFGKIFRGDVRINAAQVQEALMNAALAPGSIVTLNSSGAFIAHNAAGERGAHFVLSEDYLGQNDTDTNVASGDRAVAYIPQPGEYFAALVADGNNITAVGTQLASNGSGALAIATTGQEVLFIAEEVYNNNTGSSQLVRVRPGNGEAA